MKDLDNVVRLHPGDPYPHIVKATSAAAFGYFGLSVQEFDKAIALSKDQNFKGVVMAFKLEPLFMMNNVNDVLALSDELIALTGSSKGKDTEFVLSCAYTMKAKSLNELQLNDKSIQTVDKFKQLYPNLAHPASTIVKGEALCDLGRVGEANKEFIDALKLDPYNLGAYLAKGRCAMMNRNYAAAIPDLKSALLIDPRPEIMLYLGVSLHNTGQHEQAVAVLEELVTLEPNNPQVNDFLNEARRNIKK